MSQDPKDKILESAEQVFMRLGVKSVTMDEVSRELGISKKTLYQFVTDKGDLVKQCFSRRLEKNCNEINKFTKSGNPVEEVLEIIKFMAVSMKKINPMAMQEIRRFYPESWSLFEAYRHNHILKTVRDNMTRGVGEGYYRLDLNIPFISRIHLEVITMLIGDQFEMSEVLTFQQQYLHFMEYHLRGICTPQGIEILEKHIQELSSN